MVKRTCEQGLMKKYQPSGCCFRSSWFWVSALDHVSCLPSINVHWYQYGTMTWYQIAGTCMYRLFLVIQSFNTYSTLQLQHLKKNVSISILVLFIFLNCHCNHIATIYRYLTYLSTYLLPMQTHLGKQG